MSSKPSFPQFSTKMIKRLAREEAQKAIAVALENKHKWFRDDIALSTSGIVLSACPIAAGDAVDTRDGQEITVRSAQINGYFESGDPLNHVRIMLVHWKNASLVSLDDILRSTSSDAIFSNYLFNRAAPFRVLIDKLYYVDDNGGPQGKVFKINKKFKGKGLKVTFNGTTAAAYGDSNLFWILVSNSGVAPHVPLSYNISTTYEG